MLKKNKGLLIITSIVILLPILAGLIFYDQLPATLNTHWGVDGNVDGQGDKMLMIFLLPCILLAVHWICILFTAKDPGNQAQNEKIFRLVLWMIPLLSLFANAIMYLSSAGHGDNIAAFIPVLLGLVFVLIGNYMPKTKRNHTLGIKVSWTLSSEENWYATHRLAGKTWVIGGILMILSILLPGDWMMIALAAILVVMVAVPFIYSWRHYRMLAQQGKAPEKAKAPYSKKVMIASYAALGAILILVCVLMFTGSMEIAYEDDSFTLTATFWQPLTVSYDEIDSLEYRENWVHGGKVSGFNSARLLLGAFEHKEIGKYTSYCYAGTDECVILAADGNILVIAGQDEAATQAIHDTLLERMKE